MIRRLIVGLLVLGALSSYATDRPQRNLKHAYITPWTHLTPADGDAIVRLISNRDQQPIIGISAHRRKKDGSTISVYTGREYTVSVDSATYKSWHGYDLAKKSGTWRITFHGDCSHTIANLDLSGQIRRLQQERKQ
jgi:hypothetical protein